MLIHHSSIICNARKRVSPNKRTPRDYNLAVGFLSHAFSATKNRGIYVKLFLILTIAVGTTVLGAGAVLRARHHCLPAANVARVLGHHPDCVVLIDGPTCTEATVRDGGCKDTRIRNFTRCGAVLYNEVEDPEGPQPQQAPQQPPQQPPQHLHEGESGLGTTFSHCSYTAKPAGAACYPQLQLLEASGGAGGSGSGGVTGGAGGTPDTAVTAAVADDGRPVYECGGGSLAGLCLPAGSPAAEHPQCSEFVCDQGLCGPPVPINEGGECLPAGPGPGPPLPLPCHRRACRSGRCVLEPLPDDTPCGPTGRCSEHVCLGGACVRTAEEDGVLCGPSSSCGMQVCIAGECVEERRPDGELCWSAPGECPRTCAGGKCVACSCGSAYAFWAGRQRLPGFQWTPFPTDLPENSFGGYFNLLEEELDIPPVQLPYNHSSPAARHAEDSAILVCSGCRLNMRVQPGANMVQDGALVTGSVGLATSPVRGGTYITLDVVMFPNRTHHHLLVGWNPWASLSPPPLHSPHRWGGTPASPPTAGYSVAAAGAAPGAFGGAVGSAASSDPRVAVLHHGPLPHPTTQHSAWAYVRRRRVRWAFTTVDQSRSVFVGLHVTVASCLRAPPLSPSSSTGPRLMTPAA